MKPEYIDELVQKGWIEIDKYFPAELVHSLCDYSHTLYTHDHFKKASIKNSIFKERDESVRRDSIFWIDDWSINPALKIYGNEIDSLMHFLKNELRISIKSFEGHFAFYSKGDFYKKHLDQHLSTRHRIITFVTYLNDAEGGELIIFDREDRNKVIQTIKPKTGKLVLFNSAEIFHEVRPAITNRLSLTGWFRDDLPLGIEEGHL